MKDKYVEQMSQLDRIEYKLEENDIYYKQGMRTHTYIIILFFLTLESAMQLSKFLIPAFIVLWCLDLIYFIIAMRQLNKKWSKRFDIRYKGHKR